ncbi:MAG: sulfite exporter TauE/SafE family protein [Eubacteriaceae bacterium]|jgi:uncharacterized membrane protein YfcA|nr:sulfite exporter TauE/SafE family protein [Eubacteriaceae bacterium]
MLFVLIGFFATFIGTIVGVGGGFIIRPLLNVVGIAKGLASFTSSLSVFTMSLTNLIILKRQGKEIDFKNIIFVGIGAATGALIGGSLVPKVTTEFINQAYLVAIFIMFASVVVRGKVKIEPVKNPLIKIVLGMMCGTLSSFFGIGGGPFLMSVLLIFFDLNPKDAAIQSVLITMLSTSSSLISYTTSGYLDFSLAIYCVPAAVLGGIVGRKATEKISNKTVRYSFYVVLIAIFAVQCYTVFF